MCGKFSGGVAVRGKDDERPKVPKEDRRRLGEQNLKCEASLIAAGGRNRLLMQPVYQEQTIQIQRELQRSLKTNINENDVSRSRILSNV